MFALALVLAIVIVIIYIVYDKKRHKATNTGASRLAEDLRDERKKSDIILGAIEDGVVLLDSKKTIQLFNTGASKITGWPIAEALNLDYKSVIKLVNDKDEPYIDGDHPLEKVFESSAPIRDNNALLASRSDKRVPLFLSASPLVDEQGNIRGAVAVFRDVSQERQEEKQRGEFISTASHEMRTPVAAIEGYLSLALNDKVATIDSRARDYLEKAHASTQHLGQLFQDLLTSAKAEDGRLINHPEVVELSGFSQALADDLRFSAEKKGLAVEYALGSSNRIDASAGENIIQPLYYANVDPDRLREVITNLFDNACKYTEEGKVTLGITGDENVVQLYIKDTGNGIAREDIPHLFQKFYRVDSSATRTIGGTGLGLFICRKIIELYNGRIWVESELGHGSTFFINLPRLSSQKAEQMKKAATSEKYGTPLQQTTTS